jgi:hypothetical protein
MRLWIARLALVLAPADAVALPAMLGYDLDSGRRAPVSEMRIRGGNVKTRVAILAPLLLAGCASGPHYWTKTGATPESFAADHGPCFKDATIGYGVGSEKAYKACMLQKGWARIQGSANAPPDVPHFRGPEDDDDFKSASPEDFMEKARKERDAGPRDPRCDQPRNARAPGTVCP